MIYGELFWAFLQVGLFSFGGGYAAVPLIQSQIVERYHWLSGAEFVDILTISQMTPGPVAINSATFVGQRVAGIPGAMVATLGCILPSCVIVLTLARFYRQYQKQPMVQGALAGLRPAVVALIASAGCSVLSLAIWPAGAVSFHRADIDWLAFLVALSCLLILRRWKCNPIWVMAGAGLTGLLLYGAGLLPGETAG